MHAEGETWIHVDLERQELLLYAGREVQARWPVSTALNGPGECVDSGCTPRGEHRVRLRIGQGCPLNTVFVARRPTGEIYDASLREAFPTRDWILTRILWLTGTEHGFNRGRDCDTLRRFIYIHGCPDHEPMGVPVSHGCVRMRNHDIVQLFDRVATGTRVVIGELPQVRDD